MRYLPFVLLLLVLGAGCAADTSAPIAQEVHEVTKEDSEVMDVHVVGSGSMSVIPIVDVAEESVVEDAAEVAIAMQMTAKNFSFSPSTISAAPGQEIAVTFTNTGTHTFAIDEIGLNSTVTNGGTIRFSAPTAVGNYRFYCAMGSHATLGMEGILTVK